MTAPFLEIRKGSWGNADHTRQNVLTHLLPLSKSANSLPNVHLETLPGRAITLSDYRDS